MILRVGIMKIIEVLGILLVWMVIDQSQTCV